MFFTVYTLFITRKLFWNHQ